MRNTIIFAREGDTAATERLDSLREQFVQVARRNSDLWERNLEPTRKVIVFPGKNADAIAAAYRAAGVEVEVVNEGQKDDVETEEIEADEEQGGEAEEVVGAPLDLLTVAQVRSNRPGRGKR